MKKLLALSMVAIFAMALMFSGCGKYDNGPKFSLASKKGRVVNVWKQVKQIDNGVEQAVNPDWANESEEFTKDGKVIDTYISGGVTVTNSDQTWAFDSKKTSIVITSASGGVSYSFTYKILRLKGNELWLQFSSGANTYESHFESK
jgi:hypothetical protein